MNVRVSFTTLKGPVPEPSARASFGRFFGLDQDNGLAKKLTENAQKSAELLRSEKSIALEVEGSGRATEWMGEAPDKTKVKIVGFRVWIKTKYTGISSRFYKTMKRIKKKLDNEWLIAKGVEKIKAAREIALKPIAMIREWAQMFHKNMAEIFPPSHAHPDSRGHHGPHHGSQHNSHAPKPPENQPPRIEIPEAA